MHGDDLINFLLNAYRDGVFPMAESAEDEDVAFYRPHMRGLIPIETLHIPQSLHKILRQQKFNVTIDKAFADIIDGCAVTTPKRDNTWINKTIRDLYIALHHQGHAHSIECWNADGSLAGGLYGVSIGAVFCGESMFSNTTGASKVALVHLCALLWQNEFTVLDTQFINPHLLQFGAYEMPQEEYEELIKTEMDKDVRFANVDLKECLKAYLDFLSASDHTR